ncbi:hypothetical protein Lal_00032494 [Lupinus albus]|nr:hypothetical protein Lal_00032494 [Lupinus albus]
MGLFRIHVRFRSSSRQQIARIWGKREGEDEGSEKTKEAIHRGEKVRTVRRDEKTKAVRRGGNTKATWFSGLLLRLSSPSTVTAAMARILETRSCSFQMVDMSIQRLKSNAFMT